MSYKAIVARIYTTPVPGANTLVQGKVLGYEVAVDKSTVDGTLGIFFPTDGQLSEEFATANDLISRGTDPVTGEHLGGYFSSDRRVRTVKFMKGTLRSEGFFCPMSYINFALPQNVKGINNLKEGDEFDSIMGIPICNKYFTPATLRAMARDKQQGVKRLQYQGFPEHVDTSHWQRFHRNSIPEGTIYTISEKVHGTSGRTGSVKITRKLNWWQKFTNWLRLTTHQTEFYKKLVGSRRVVLNDREDAREEGFRFDVIQGVLPEPGVVYYYEMVGHEPSGKPIMADADPKKVTDKGFAKTYANMPDGMMRFKYGTSPNEAEIYLYRVTKDGKDLNQDQVRIYAYGQAFRLPHVFSTGVIRDKLDIEVLAALVDQHTDGPSAADPSHIREGVVVRLDYPDGTVKFLKNKSMNFGILEGYLKNNDSYVDTEEAG